MKTLGAILLTFLVAFHIGYVQGQHHHPKVHHPKVHHRVVAKKRHVKHWVVFTSGVASFYGCPSVEACSIYGGNDNTQGKPTASGVIFNTNKHMCSMPNKMFHREPVVIIRNNRTHRQAYCRIYDFGPNPHLHRVLDVSYQVKQELGMDGMADVTVFVKNTE